MSYFLHSDNPLAQRLAELDRERDAIRAKLVDEKLKAEIDSATTEEYRNVATERWNLRIKRREKEQRLKQIVPPGHWDNDLDTYQDDEYVFDLEDGYGGRLVRSPYLTWNGYVILPDNHPFANKHYDFFHYLSPEGLPHPPCELTFSNGYMMGFDHAHSVDVKPLNLYSADTYSQYNNYNISSTGQGYLTFSAVKQEVEALAEYFRKLARNHSSLA
jgi:hypothetical protein